MNFVKNSFLIPIISICFISLISSCENNIATVNTITAESEKNLPIESGKNVEIFYSDSAQVRFKLTAPVFNTYAGKKSYRELPKGMLVVFYDEHGKEETKLTSDYGIGFDNGTSMEHMEAKRNVVVTNKKGERLNTEHLIWNAATKKYIQTLS